jgi:hypothetical protein
VVACPQPGWSRGHYKLVSELEFLSGSWVVACGLKWLGVLQIGIRAHGFNTEPGWATNVEFGVKIPQGFDVQSARAALRELLGGNGKLRRYSNSRKLAEKGDHGNCGLEPQKLNLGH